MAEPGRYVAVLLLARVACEVVAIVLLAAALEHYLGQGWHTFLIVAVIMIAVLYLLAGVGPQILGRQYERAAALAVADVLYPVVRLLGPMPAAVARAGQPAHPRPARPGRRAGQRRNCATWSTCWSGARSSSPGERAMIHSVFELGDTIVREVMVPRTDMVFVERDKTVRQALSLALRSGFSRIPVVGENEDDVIGIAYLKDLVRPSQEHPERESVEPVDRGDAARPRSCRRASRWTSCSKRCRPRRIHVAIVIDEYGGTAGLVTIEDILEEIVGEITDEYDQEQPTVEWLARTGPGSPRGCRSTDLAELFGITIEAEDVETVGGLLAHAIGRVPIAGSVGTVAGLRLTAESLAGRRNRIGTVTVERVGAPAPQPAAQSDGDG